jgi:glutaredoxin
MKQSVVLYTSPGCPDCAAVRRFLAERAVAFTERDLSDPAVAEEAKRRYGVRVAPITVIGEQVLYGIFEQQRRRLEAIGTVNSAPQLTLTTRLLHIGLSVGVTLQLLLSTFMERPRPGVTRPRLDAVGFDVHEVNGLLLLPVIIGWLVWLFIRRREDGPRVLFPWLSSVPRRALLGAAGGALAAARQRRMPSEEATRLLAAAVHGLGALCALFMASTGATVWLGMSAQGEMPGWTLFVLALHQAAANLMWAYLVGHAAMAGLHHFLGDATVRRMFSLKRGHG